MNETRERGQLDGSTPAAAPVPVLNYATPPGPQPRIPGILVPVLLLLCQVSVAIGLLAGDHGEGDGRAEVVLPALLIPIFAIAFGAWQCRAFAAKVPLEYRQASSARGFLLAWAPSDVQRSFAEAGLCEVTAATRAFALLSLVHVVVAVFVRVVASATAPAPGEEHAWLRFLGVIHLASVAVHSNAWLTLLLRMQRSARLLMTHHA